MKTIKEYLLDKKCVTPQTAYLTRNAEVVGVQDTLKGLVLLAVVDPTETLTDLRTFKVCSIEETIYADNLKYIGNFQSIVGVQHVVEYTNN